MWQACVEIDVPCVFHLHCHAWSTVLLNFCWGLGSYVLCKYLYIYEVCVSSTLTEIQHDKALQCAIGVRIHSGSHDFSMLIVSILLTQYSRIMSHYDFLYITRFECACALFRTCNCISLPLRWKYIHSGLNWTAAVFMTSTFPIRAHHHSINSSYITVASVQISDCVACSTAP